MTEIAEFRHVREGLADVLRTGGSVVIREESLVRMDPAAVRSTLEQLRDAALARGFTLTIEHELAKCWYVVSWGRALPADPGPPPPTYPDLHHSPLQREIRASGWAS